MLEGQGVIVDLRDVLSISDPVVRGVIESSIIGGLSGVQFRQFRLTPRIMVLLCDKSALAPVIEALQRLQRELLASHCGRVEWKVYDLADELQLFRSDCRTAVEVHQTIEPDHAAFQPDGDRLGALLHIIDVLRTIDLAAHIRQQNAVRIGQNLARKVEFQERWVDLAELEQSIGVPIRNSTWKFLHVTEFLDFKVLDLLSQEWSGDYPISINFRAVNTLAPRFDNLLIRIPTAARNNLIFELSVSEFLHDRTQALAAAAKLRANGLRIGIDGVALPILDRVKGFFPKVQYVKMPWNDAFMHLNREQTQKFKDVVTSNREETFVLTRCGRIDDVETGMALGFSVFQGWGVPATSPGQPSKSATAPRHDQPKKAPTR